MTSSVAELPRITGMCPELLTATVRRALTEAPPIAQSYFATLS